MGVLGIPGKPYEGPDLILIEEWFGDIQTERTVVSPVIFRAMQGLNKLTDDISDAEAPYYSWTYRRFIYENNEWTLHTSDVMILVHDEEGNLELKVEK